MLTAIQMKTYRLIRRCILLEGDAPTYRRIAENLGVTVSSAYIVVTRICERGWLNRQGRQIAIKRDEATPTTTEMFDYFVVDYKNLTTDGWPRLVDVA